MSKTSSEEKSIRIPAWLVTGTPERARMLELQAQLNLIVHELKARPIVKRQAG